MSARGSTPESSQNRREVSRVLPGTAEAAGKGLRRRAVKESARPLGVNETTTAPAMFPPGKVIFPPDVRSAGSLHITSSLPSHLRHKRSLLRLVIAMAEMHARWLPCHDTEHRPAEWRHTQSRSLIYAEHQQSASVRGQQQLRLHAS